MFKSKAGQEMIEKMSWIADLMIVSILWFIFSIPIITVGASTSAMYRAIQDRQLHGNGNIWIPFWKTFKSSFGQSTILWLGYAVLVSVFLLNQALLRSNLATSWVNQFSQIFLMMMIILFLPVLMMGLSYVARFTDDTRTVLKNVMALSLVNFVDSVKVFLIASTAVVFVYLIPIFVIVVPAFAISKISPKLERIFNQYTEEDLLGDS